MLLCRVVEFQVFILLPCQINSTVVELDLVQEYTLRIKNHEAMLAFQQDMTVV